MSKVALIFAAAAALIILGIVFMVQPAIPGRVPNAATIEPNKYYAVLLSNNSVYFGKLQGFGSPYPVLTDVYYIQSNVDPNTKAVNNVLIKRGKELHAPDRMILNEKTIVFIEPVTEGSKVQQLINESKR